MDNEEDELRYESQDTLPTTTPRKTARARGLGSKMLKVLNTKRVKFPPPIKMIENYKRFDLTPETLGNISISVAQLLDISPLLRRSLAVNM